MKLRFLGAVLPLLMLGSGPAAHAEEPFVPTKPVDVVVHNGPGGGADVLARTMISFMQKQDLLPVPFTVVAKQGGGSTTAMNYLMEKSGDAYTLAVFTSLYPADPLVQKEAKVTLDQITPIARMTLEPGLVVVKEDSPYKTLKDFIDAAKAEPGAKKQSGGSIYARDAIIRYSLMAETGADWSFVSFPSSGERISAVLGGHVDMMMIEAAEIGELLRSGKLRAIAQIAPERTPGFPDVPTLKEAGFNTPDVPQARGIIAPPNMPPEAVKYYSDLFKKLSESPEWQAYLKENQTISAYLPAEETGPFLAEYTKVLRDILVGAKVDVVR